MHIIIVCLELVTVILMGKLVDTLKIKSLNIPLMADPRFDQPQLTCYYEFGPEGLFTVKWYKDDREFYRYLPTFDPQIIHFPLSDITLSETGFVATKTTLEKRIASPELCNTTSCTIKLLNITVDTGGEYTCEISSERPYFNTDMRSANLTIVALPSKNPSIETSAHLYTIGDVLSASCTSSPSIPRSRINWLINGEPPPENSIREVLDEMSPDEFGLTRSRSELQLRLEDYHFVSQRDQMILTCEAAIRELKKIMVTHTFYTLEPPRRLMQSNERLEWNNIVSKTEVSSIASLTINSMYVFVWIIHFIIYILSDARNIEIMELVGKLS